MVDTGATLLSLPTALIKQLGLPVSGEAEVKTANASVFAWVFREANLDVNGRRSTFDCLELTEPDTPLVGSLPVEALGLEPDLHNQQLRLLSMKGDNSYLYVV